MDLFIMSHSNRMMAHNRVLIDTLERKSKMELGILVSGLEI